MLLNYLFYLLIVTTSQATEKISVYYLIRKLFILFRDFLYFQNFSWFD